MNEQNELNIKYLQGNLTVHLTFRREAMLSTQSLAFYQVINPCERRLKSFSYLGLTKVFTGSFD